MNQAQFARALGVKQSTVSRWENGSVPDGVMLARIAKLTGITYESFAFSDLEAGREGPKLFIKGQVAAGVWEEAWEWDQADWIPYQGGSHILAPFEARYGLTVTGDSMNLVYPPGTVLDCVDCIEAGIHKFESGQRVIVVRKRHSGEYELTVKEYLITDSGEHWLVPKSNNPAFQQPIPLHDGTAEIEEARIIAVVRGAYCPE